MAESSDGGKACHLSLQYGPPRWWIHQRLPLSDDGATHTDAPPNSTLRPAHRRGGCDSGRCFANGTYRFASVAVAATAAAATPSMSSRLHATPRPSTEGEAIGEAAPSATRPSLVDLLRAAPSATRPSLVDFLRRYGMRLEESDTWHVWTPAMREPLPPPSGDTCSDGVVQFPDAAGADAASADAAGADPAGVHAATGVDAAVAEEHTHASRLEGALTGSESPRRSGARTGRRPLNVSMCLAPAGTDHISDQIRSKGRWWDCSPLVDVWRANASDLSCRGGGGGGCGSGFHSGDGGIALEIGGNLGACTVELLVCIGRLDPSFPRPRSPSAPLPLAPPSTRAVLSACMQVRTAASIVVFEPHPLNLFRLTSTLHRLAADQVSPPRRAS